MESGRGEQGAPDGDRGGAGSGWSLQVSSLPLWIIIPQLHSGLVSEWEALGIILCAGWALGYYFKEEKAEAQRG